MTDKKIKYKGTSFEERQAMRRGPVCNQAEEVKKANIAERNLNKAKEFLRRMEEKYELELGLKQEPKKDNNAENPYIKKEKGKKNHSHIKKAPPMQTKSAIHIGMENNDREKNSDKTGIVSQGKKQDLKNAIIWSEILAPPLSKRRGR